MTTESSPSSAPKVASMRNNGWLNQTFTILCWFQGLYFLVTGLWPIFSIDTFQRVTGPKTDLWLVRTVGILIASIAIVLLVAAWRQRPSLEAGLLATFSSFSLLSVDIIYVSLGTIPPIYLVDAALEVIILAGWGLVLFQTLGARE